MIKQENHRVKLGNNTLSMFVNKNAILSWEWALSALGVIVVCQDSKNFRSDARIAFVNDRRVVEINDMVMRPSMIYSSGAFGRCSVYVPYVFFFPRSE